MTSSFNNLLGRQPERVRAVLNLLVESPYFYRNDDEELFFFLRRYRSTFEEFYTESYGWRLLVDDKCARVFKERWYNRDITESNRDIFGFRRRDECIAFMMLLEFFEHQVEEHAVTTDKRDNLRFRFGDLLQYCQQRFVALFPDDVRYSEEHVRAKILRPIMPVLERYRLLRKLLPPADMEATAADTIFEALPALYHYNSKRLHEAIAPPNLSPSKNRKRQARKPGDLSLLPAPEASLGRSQPYCPRSARCCRGFSLGTQGLRQRR